jgi:K+/H+ antiporter YhaU regulatory subunit KhtT
VSLHADLASLQSTLDQSLERLTDAVQSVQGTELDDLVGDLYEIERHLRAASRRLGRTLGDLR